MKVGDVIDGKYRIIRIMGEGGMGAVYEVRHEVVGQRYALKCLHAQHATDAAMVRRFVQEAQAAAAIGSEHIIYITDGGQDADGCPYLVMEHLEGEDLASLLKREGRLTPGRAVGLALQVCEALAPAHARGIIHRDLKPANLFLIHKDKVGEWVKVLDFGIAKVQQEISGQSRSLTKTGSTMGTPFYMAPEQFRRAKDVDQRADIYSCGVILYQMLSSRLPFEADTYEELIVAVITEEPAPLGQLEPGADPELASVVMRAIARESETRYQSMDELAEALLPFGPSRTEVVAAPRHSPDRPPPTQLVAPPQARDLPPTLMHQAHDLSPTLAHQEPPPAQKLPWKPALVGVLAILGIAGGAVALWPRGGTDEGEAPDPRTEVAQRPKPVPAGWVRIEPGTFTMGSPIGEESREDDETQHRVTLTRPFLLMEAEVTQAQFHEVMGRNPSSFAECGPSCPVDRVSWWDAVAYVNALSRREAQPECYELIGCTGTPGGGCGSSHGVCTGDYQCREVRFAGLDCRGYRLPTEAEWEYAAWAGSTEARDGAVGEVGWYSDSGPTTHPVKSKSPNAWGLYDMLGNVWEWNHDWYRTNLGDVAVTNPSAWSTTASYRALRGGGWNCVAPKLRAANRRLSAPRSRLGYFGFRVAVSAASTVE